MSRSLASVVVVTLVLCAFVGCKKKSATAPDDEEPSPSYAEPNQVAWSGAPITTAGCAGATHTWTWTLAITENNNADGMTVNYLDSTLDGVAQPRQTLNSALKAKGTVTIQRAVCHGDGVQHTVVEKLVSSYKGAESTFGNTITLLARPR